MDIKEYTAFCIDEILPLYASVGWTAYTQDPAALKTGFANSLLTLAAYENNALIGLIRVVGDGSTVVLVQDLLVHPAHQRKGIGSALLREILTRYVRVRQLFLLTDDTPQTTAFYAALGLTPAHTLGLCTFLHTR